METHLEIANRLKLIELNALEKVLIKADEIGKMITGLRKALSESYA